MNKIEKVAYNWLINQGFNKENIIFRSNKTPDFIIKDGRKFEVKEGRGKKTKNILIHKKQFPDLIKDLDTKILVFEKDSQNPIAIVPINKITEDTWKIDNISISWRKFNKNTMTYGLRIPEKIWEEFRKTLMKDDVINTIITTMIKERIKKFKEK